MPLEEGRHGVDHVLERVRGEDHVVGAVGKAVQMVRAPAADRGRTPVHLHRHAVLQHRANDLIPSKMGKLVRADLELRMHPRASFVEDGHRRIRALHDVDL